MLNHLKHAMGFQPKYKRQDYVYVYALKKVCTVHKCYGNGAVVRIWPVLVEEGGRIHIQAGYYKAYNFAGMAPAKADQIAAFNYHNDRYCAYEMASNGEGDPSEPNEFSDDGFSADALAAFSREIGE